ALAEAAFDRERLAQAARQSGRTADAEVLEKTSKELFEASAKALKGGGIQQVPARLLEEAGLQGGLHYAGFQLLGHDAVRHITRPFARATGKLTDKTVHKLTTNLGSRDLRELRRVYREGVKKVGEDTFTKATPRDMATAVLQRSARQLA